MNGLETYHNILSQESCEKIIELFDKDKRKVKGETAGGLSDSKKSMDIGAIFDKSEWEEYNKLILPSLVTLASNIKEKYPFLDHEGCAYWILCPFWNVQHYKDGEGYFATHCEHSYKNPYRMMAWMIYLNDADCGTEFPYQDTVVEAEQGKGVIWSAGWTHPHKGVTPNIGDKYIATGWFNYYDPKENQKQQRQQYLKKKMSKGFG